MSIRHFVLRPDQHERALNVVGTQVTVLASNAATQSCGITLQQGDEGAGPPPHRRDWDEALYVLKGEVDFQCDGQAYAFTLGHARSRSPRYRAWLQL
jgi:quercetin dioxygenase-like cupin family protein